LLHFALPATTLGHDHATKEGHGGDEESTDGGAEGEAHAMADEYWAKELTRRAVVIADWNKHSVIQRQQDAEVAKAVSFTNYAASQGESGGESLPTAARSGTDSGILCSPRLRGWRQLVCGFFERQLQ
jgi:hypothetical protein